MKALLVNKLYMALCLTVIRKVVRILKIIGIVLIVVGVIGIMLGSMMFGDIGIAAFIGAVTAILSGIGFLSVNKVLKKNKEEL